MSPPVSRPASSGGYRNFCATSCARTRRTTRAGSAPTTAALDLTGCGSAELRAQVTAIHDAEAAQRQADADARSAEIDPFTREVDIDCE